MYATPADTQATALTEFLQTRTTALAIAKAANVASTLNLSDSVRSNPALLDDALYDEISRHMTVTVQGYNLYDISYANPNPVIAQKVVDTAIQTYRVQSQDLSIAQSSGSPERPPPFGTSLRLFLRAGRTDSHRYILQPTSQIMFAIFAGRCSVYAHNMGCGRGLGRSPA